MIKGTVTFFFKCDLKFYFCSLKKDRPYFTLMCVISLLVLLYVQNLIAKIGRA